MTKLQKIGLVMSVVAAILWIIWLFAWWYSMFEDVQVMEYDLETTYNVNYIIYYALIVIFAVWFGLIFGEYSRKSLKKSLIVLVVSCLVRWLFRTISIFFLWLVVCWWCVDVDRIGYSVWILFLVFFILWFVSLFYATKYLTSSNKWWTIVLLSVLVFVCVLFVWINISCRRLSLYCLNTSVGRVFWLSLIISIILCIIAWIKSYNGRKKSS